RPSGYEPDELPGCSTPRPWMRTILRSRFHATFFLPRSRIWHDFEQKQITKAYFFVQNLRQGEAAHFIKRGGLLSSLRLIF
ncbi:TPA: hypothetical protein ACF3DX_001288, partial [Escherichia coli]